MVPGWRSRAILLVLTIVLAAAMCAPALAGDKLIPGGPPPADGTQPLSSIPSYDEVVKALYNIEATSKGAVDVFTLTEAAVYSITKTEAGRELYVAKLGTGPIRVWVTANIHGGEQLTTEAVLDALKYLGSSKAPDAVAIREALTIYAIPMMNPDGREMRTRGTQLIDDVTGVPGAFVDLNRDWYPGMQADETKAVYAYFCATKPHYLLDLHHQGFKQVPYTDYATSMSMGISLSPDRDTIPAEFKDPVRQMAAYVYDSIEGYGYTHIDRYQLIGFPAPGLIGELDYSGGMTSAVMRGNVFLNWDGLNDADWKCPAMFFETKGNSYDNSLGQKANGYLVKQNAQGVMAWLYGIATGDAWDVDPMHWYDIPAWSPIWGYYTDIGPVPAAAQFDAADYVGIDYDFLW